MYYIEEIKNGGVLNSVLLLISLLPHSALNSSCLGRGVFFFISFLLLLITAQGKPPIPMWCAIICLCVCNLQAMPTGNMSTLLGHLLLSPCLDLVLGVMTALFFFLSTFMPVWDWTYTWRLSFSLLFLQNIPEELTKYQLGHNIFMKPWHFFLFLEGNNILILWSIQA